MRRSLTPWDLRTNGEPVDALTLMTQVDDIDEMDELAISHVESQDDLFAPIPRYPATSKAIRRRSYQIN